MSSHGCIVKNALQPIAMQAQDGKFGRKCGRSEREGTTARVRIARCGHVRPLGFDGTAGTKYVEAGERIGPEANPGSNVCAAHVLSALDLIFGRYICDSRDTRIQKSKICLVQFIMMHR